MSQIFLPLKVINNPQENSVSQKNKEIKKICKVMVLCNLKAATHNITASNSVVGNEISSLSRV
jgi:hypothetical protein